MKRPSASAHSVSPWLSSARRIRLRPCSLTNHARTASSTPTGVMERKSVCRYAVRAGGRPPLLASRPSTSSNNSGMAPPWTAAPPPKKYRPNVTVPSTFSRLPASGIKLGDMVCPRPGRSSRRAKICRRSGTADWASRWAQLFRSPVRATVVAASGAAAATWSRNSRNAAIISPYSGPPPGLRTAGSCQVRIGGNPPRGSGSRSLRLPPVISTRLMH